MFSARLDRGWQIIFYAFSLLSLLTGLAAIYQENYYLLLIPAGLLFLYLSVNDLRFIYLSLLLMIPLSIEVSLPEGFATDFPTELLIGGLMFLFIPYALARATRFERDFLKHPLIFLIMIHYAWILVATVFSSDIYISLKYAMAKTWYIVTFVFVTSVMIRNVQDFRKAFWFIVVPLLFTVCYSLVRHAQTDFTFETVNTPMLPFFRNHVNYACFIAQMIPFVILAISWYRRGTLKRNLLWLSLILLLVAVYFSYTRSAWLSLFAALIAIPVIQFRLMNWLLVAGFAGAILFFIYMGYHNEYLNYSPEYESTIYHPELGEHLASTFEGKDISSAERLYRWVAGIRMWLDEPLTGFGPGNFYGYYDSYTVNSFRTYVSDNPERSSIHNYFLLVLTEQGIIGLLIFVAFTIALLYYGQRIYHQTREKNERRYVLAVLLCLVIIYMNTFLSDLLETDKIGSFYFICIALLVNQDLRNRKGKVVSDL